MGQKKMAQMGIAILILICLLMALIAHIEGRDMVDIEIDRLADDSRRRARKRPLKRCVKFAKYWRVQ